MPAVESSSRLRVAWLALLVIAVALPVLLVRDAPRGRAEGPAGTTTALDAPSLSAGAAPPSPGGTAPPLAATTAWSIAYPSTWDRGDSELMPGLVGIDSLTLATFPLRPGGTRCAHLPENALRDLGPADALVSVFFMGEAQTAATPWPVGGFDDTVFPASSESEAAECSGRSDLEVHWGSWNLGPKGFLVLAVFGPDVAAATRTTTWQILSSLQGDTSGPGYPCVVTLPPDPGLTPPEPYPPAPSAPSMRWYGTADLWTPLPADGSYPQRKSMWWSSRFEGGGREPDPDISVVFERLDPQGVAITAGPPGTSGFTPQDGWFMIAAIDPEDSGCWKVTATYRGATLSYVFRVP